MSDGHRGCEVQWVATVHEESRLDESSAGYLVDSVICEYRVVVCSDMVSMVRYNCLSLKPCVPSDKIVDVSAGSRELVVVPAVRAVVVRYARVDVVTV